MSKFDQPAPTFEAHATPVTTHVAIVEGHATALDRPAPGFEGHATAQDYPAADRASQIWSGPSSVTWAQKNQDYPASLDCAIGFADGSGVHATATGGPGSYAEARPNGGPGSPYATDALNRQYAEAIGVARDTDKPDFLKNLGHNIGETVKHIVAPWTMFDNT